MSGAVTQQQVELVQLNAYIVCSLFKEPVGADLKSASIRSRANDTAVETLLYINTERERKVQLTSVVLYPCIYLIINIFDNIIIKNKAARTASGIKECDLHWESMEARLLRGTPFWGPGSCEHV